MRIGIYGGTFNPIHNGHINIIKGFYEKLKLDKIFVIPTAKPPHKESPDLLNSTERVQMCELALKDLDYCEISLIEINRQGKSYTIDTLNELKSVYNNAQFFLLMGEDMFMIIDKWKNCQQIFDIANICVAVRSDYGVENLQKMGEFVKKNYPNFNYTITDINYVKASSTEIRAGKTDLLPECIRDYIIENKIYWSGKY